MANKQIILPGQTIPDIAMQNNGSVEAMFKLAMLNNQSITDALLVGSQIDIDPQPYDLRVYSNFQNYGYKPASDITQAGEEIAQPEGIGNWAIGNDFKVS